MKRNFFIYLIALLGMSGCAHVSSIKDGSEVFAPSHQSANQPTSAVASFKDQRDNKLHIGQVAALALNEPATPMNEILTNRIAARLKGDGFNITKIPTQNTTDIASNREALKQSEARVLISGRLNEFFVKSFDALMEPAKGQCLFSVQVVDATGNVVFDRSYTAFADHFIGLTGQFGSDAAIDKTVNASVDLLFNDAEFQVLINNIKNTA